MWGQRDHLRTYQFVGDKLNPTPLVMRPEANQGHPGAMLSISANGDKDGILWAAIHATGDSWHESRPGILHAYEANNVMHELWNSLQNPGRDDCKNYSKMAPPTVANGKVYLASFGDKNTGSGQVCVYGLLPDGPAPGIPTDVKAAPRNGRVDLTWGGVHGATIYDVKKSTDNGHSFELIAVGLTTPAFEDIAVSQGKTYLYEVGAANANGESGDSRAASASFAQPVKTGVSH
jgi:hypothetical protein